MPGWNTSRPKDTDIFIAWLFAYSKSAAALSVVASHMFPLKTKNMHCYVHTTVAFHTSYPSIWNYDIALYFMYLTRTLDEEQKRDRCSCKNIDIIHSTTLRQRLQFAFGGHFDGNTITLLLRYLPLHNDTTCTCIPACSIDRTVYISPAAKTHFGGEPVFVRYSFFMIDYKKVRHAFSENAGWHPSILEHFEILAPLTHPPGNKSAYVAFSGPCILKPERLTKLIFTNPIASIARTSGITFKHILIFQMGWAHPWK